MDSLNRLKCLLVVALLNLAGAACTKYATVEDLAKLVRADFEEIKSALISYQRAHNRLPSSLDDIDTSRLNVTDWFSIGTDCRRQYWYVISGSTDRVVVGSVGPDRIAGTGDDIFMIIGNQSSVSDAEIATFAKEASQRQICIPVSANSPGVRSRKKSD